MRTTRFSIPAALLAIAMAAPLASADEPLEQSKDLKEARIKPATARAAALKECAGTIVSEELEHERGGSGLRYSFDIRRDGVTHEVGIDAITGAVLENSIEGPHQD